MKNTWITVIVAVVVGVAAFFGGVAYQKHSLNTQLANLQNLTGQERRQALQQLGLANVGGGGGGFGGRNGGQGGGFVAGKIISKDANSITVQLGGNGGQGGGSQGGGANAGANSGANSSATGGTKIIFLSGTSQILKSGPGTAADLQVGQNVTVNGTANQDGSVTGEMIQIRPQMPVTTPGQ